MDSFTLPLLKICFRHRGYNYLAHVEFLGQNSTRSTDELQGVLSDKKQSELFLEFSKKQYCEENVLFLDDINKLINNTGAFVLLDLINVYNNYIPAESPKELNITSKTRTEAEENMKKTLIQYQHGNDASTTKLTKDMNDDSFTALQRQRKQSVACLKDLGMLSEINLVEVSEFPVMRKGSSKTYNYTS
eukprot:Pgem_evm1s5953